MQFFEKDFSKLLKANALEQRRRFILKNTNCGRVYDRNISQFPVTVDLYAKYVRVTDYSEDGLSEETVETIKDLCRRMLYVEKDYVIFQRRAKRENKEQHEIQSTEPLLVEVLENGHSFTVDLQTHIDTGLFLDMEPCRTLIGEQSNMRDVLNLFSYTGSFSVYAAKGGAKTVTSVDMSNTYTTWCQQNLALNGYVGDFYKCICSDAKKFVLDAIKENQRYDIIIFDPPCFSNSRKMDYDFDVQKDYQQWLALLSRLLRKEGFILFCTNLTSFGMDGTFKRRNKIKEITSEMKAEGFTNKTGIARSFILKKEDEKFTLDDDSLTLNWNEDVAPFKKSHKDDNRSSYEKRTERKEYKKEDRPRREYRSDRRDFSDRPKRDFRDRSDRRDFSDRPRRDFRDKSDRRDFSDRPRRDFRDKSDRRDFSDRPRRDFRDRSDREFEGRRDFSDRPRRDFRDRSDRDFERRREFSDRPKREFGDRDSRPRRDFDSRRDFSDRPKRDFGERDSRPRRDFSSAPAKKPYGFDTFKPARDRNDSKQFFWLDDDDLKD